MDERRRQENGDKACRRRTHLGPVIQSGSIEVNKLLQCREAGLLESWALCSPMTNKRQV